MHARRPRPVLRASAVLVIASCLVAACGGTSASSYCHEVTNRQKHLSEIVDGGDKDALIQALPDFRALESEAPEDIRADWATVTKAVEVLQKAVEGGDKEAIAAAATALGSSDVEAALADVQQQVRDVCHTPLTL